MQQRLSLRLVLHIEMVAWGGWQAAARIKGVQGDFYHGVSAAAVARVAMERRELSHQVSCSSRLELVPCQWTKELGTQVIYTKHACEHYCATLTSSHLLFCKSLRTILTAFAPFSPDALLPCKLGLRGCYWAAAQPLTANLPTNHHITFQWLPPAVSSASITCQQQAFIKTVSL